MRIAVIAAPWVSVPPDGYGGTERVLDDLCRGLTASGQDVLLYTTGDSTCPVQRAWTYAVARGTECLSAAAELRHVVDAYEVVRDWGADIVHDHTCAGPLYSERYPGLRVVTTNHTPFDGERLSLYRSLSGRVPVIAISHHQAAGARGVDLAAVIHHGIDATRYPVGTGDGGYALFLGRMSPDKGVHVAIEAARRAGVPLRVAAKMSDRDEYRYFEERIRPQLGRGAEFLGEVGGDDKLRLLADATCLLNPLQWPEPFGMVAIESLACGTPVIATPAGAMPEIVDDGLTGFLRKDDDGLVSALAEVSSLDRGLCRWNAETRFSAARMAAEHVAVYSKVVGGSTTRAA